MAAKEFYKGIDSGSAKRLKQFSDHVRSVREEICRVMRLGVLIVQAERDDVYASFKERDGVVRDYLARRCLARYDRFLKKARAIIGEKKK